MIQFDMSDDADSSIAHYIWAINPRLTHWTGLQIYTEGKRLNYTYESLQYPPALIIFFINVIV